jgi:rod shape determining protein RodA
MTFLGMITYYSTDANNAMFWKQLISLSVSLFAYFLVSSLDIRYLKNNNFITVLYFFVIFLFAALALIGSVFTGAQSWFSLGFFAFQPTDFAKLVLVLLLAKYFFKRHVEINKLKHLFVSGVYMLIIFIFLFKQPDLGSALIVFFI